MTPTERKKLEHIRDRKDSLPWACWYMADELLRGADPTGGVVSEQQRIKACFNSIPEN